MSGHRCAIDGCGFIADTIGGIDEHHRTHSEAEWRPVYAELRAELEEAPKADPDYARRLWGNPEPTFLGGPVGAGDAIHRLA